MLSIDRIAAVQMTSSDKRKQNLATAAKLIAQAAADDAKLVLLPENFSGIPACKNDRSLFCELPGEGMVQEFLAEQALLHGLWLIGGSVWLRCGNGKAYNSCLVYAPDGRQTARYDKMHLFDVQVGADGTAANYNESGFFVGGNGPGTADCGGLCVGLSICYDLRFPELYRSLQAMGAWLLVVPAAFTAATGKLHWEVLLRARAIENQCYVLAANQVGKHDDGNSTWGHSMVVDPWGGIASCGGTDVGATVCSCDWAGMSDYRKLFPAIQHKKQP